MKLWLDLESRSRVNLPQVGVHVYAPQADITLMSWAVDDGPVRVDDHLTLDFHHAFKEARTIVAHNAEFDRTVLSYKVPDVRFDRWYCTMAQARRHGLPGGLEKLCAILRVPQDLAKMKDSRAMLMLFCKPNAEGNWNTAETHPEQWARFKSYGGLDVEAMREVHRRCPKWNDAHEAQIWLADQRINARGFAVDVQFAERAIDALKVAAKTADAAVEEATNGEVGSGRQVQELLGHILRTHGVDLPDMKAATLERRLNDPALPDEVRELIALRMESSRTSTSKYTTLRRCVSADHRMRGAITYCGAPRTKRWAGNRFQPHNLPRPRVGSLRGEALKREIARGIAAVKAEVFDLTSEYSLPEVMASAVRGCVVSPKGRRLTIGDYANVEGRGLVWLAGEGWKLQAFRDYDAGVGPDLYKLAYSRAFGIDVDAVDDGEERQLGKVMELMLGYEGGVGAFVTGCATYKVDINKIPAAAWHLIPEDVKEETARMWEWAVKKRRTLGLSELVFRTCDGLKRLWRRQHPKTVAMWADVKDAVIKVASGEVASATVARCVFTKEKTWLKIQLPSGSYLSYPGIKAEEDKITYLGNNQYTRQWGRIGSYGGKFVENITQALCRDALAQAMLNCEQAELDVVLHVHDELVVEDGEEQSALLERAMLDIPWAKGLPLTVAAFDTDRYHKD